MIVELQLDIWMKGGYWTLTGYINQESESLDSNRKVDVELDHCTLMGCM